MNIGRHEHSTLEIYGVLATFALCLGVISGLFVF